MNHPQPPFTGRLKSRASVYFAFTSAFVLASALTGCGEGTAPKHAAKAKTNETLGRKNPDPKASVASATWLAASSSLKASGTATPLADVTVRNADSNAVVGRAKASASGTWSVTTPLTSAPCQVAATLDANAPAATVTGATNCTSGTSRSATARLIRANAVVAPNPASPNGTIISPASPVRLPGATGPNAITINMGASLKFAAVGTDPNNNTPLTYLWDFNGAAPNSSVQNPGAVIFSKVGAYFVKLTVANSLGIPDQTPSERVIVVQNATGNSTQATALSASITSPVGSQTLALGGTVNFNATATGGTPPYSFVWNFGGAIPNVATQTPGSVTFAKAGTFPVRLMVTDSTKPVAQQNPTPLEVIIDVQNTIAGTNQPPSGIIRSPKTDLKIVSGEKVFFQAAAIDPDNNVPITYSWDFGGATVAPGQATSQNPGIVTFTAPAGSTTATVYTVKMVAKDAAGAVDLNPPVRTITVESVAAAAAHGPVIDSITPDLVADPTLGMINVGDTITFDAMASSPDGNALEHLWTFAGVAADEIISGPINVTFPDPGEFLVVYTVTDTVNLLSMSQELLITVTDPTAAPPPPPAAGELEAEITSPAGRVKIQAGEIIEFAGSFESDDPAITEVTYAWEFEGGDPATSTEQIPGPVTYLEPGHFIASLVVTDVNGISSEPETKHILVGDPAGAAGGGGTGGGAPATSPMVTIDSPAGDTTIMVGESLEFLSTATDPNALALTFEWDFGGTMAGSTAEDPGSVTFDAVGVFHVTLVVTNADGAEAKAHVVITVEDVPPTPPAVP